MATNYKKAKRAKNKATKRFDRAKSNFKGFGRLNQRKFDKQKNDNKKNTADKYKNFAQYKRARDRDWENAL